MAFFLFLLLSLSSFAADCNDAGKIYRVCSDQKQIFSQAMEKAAAEKRMLMVTFGADWCPWCRSLHTLMVVERETHQIGGGASVEEIGLYQDQEKVPSGWSVLEDVSAMSKGKVNKEGVPLLALVNPQNKKAVFIDTEKLEKNTKVSKGHDVKRLAAAVKKAQSQLK